MEWAWGLEPRLGTLASSAPAPTSCSSPVGIVIAYGEHGVGVPVRTSPALSSLFHSLDDRLS